VSQSFTHYGHRIGSHLGRAIYDEIEDADSNIKLVFVRIATGDADGYPLDQLKSNEVLFYPGIIYKKSA